MEKIKLLGAVVRTKRDNLPPVPRGSAMTGEGVTEVAK